MAHMSDDRCREMLVASIAELIDPSPFNRVPDGWRSEDQIKWDIARENRALKRAKRIIDYIHDNHTIYKNIF